MEWAGVTDMLWLDKVGRTASIAGSETDGLDVIGLWVSGRSMAQSIGATGGLVSGAGLVGRDCMAGRVTRPRRGEEVISCGA